MNCTISFLYTESVYINLGDLHVYIKDYTHVVL